MPLRGVSSGCGSRASRGRGRRGQASREDRSGSAWEELVREAADALAELRSKLGVTCSISAIWAALRSSGCRSKKSVHAAVEQVPGRRARRCGVGHLWRAKGSIEAA